MGPRAQEVLKFCKSVVDLSYDETPDPSGIVSANTIEKYISSI